MGSAAKFWDKIADKYARRPVTDEASYQRKLEITRSYLKPDMEVVELGCGTGSTALVHAPYVRHIRAVDVSPKMIEIARGKAEAGGIKNVTFEVSTIDALKVDEASVDVVLAMSILHLIEDWAGVVARIHGMLKPGGLFFTSSTCLGDDMNWLKLIAPLGVAIGFMPRLHFFTRDELESCIGGRGFEIAQSWKPGKGKAVFIVARKQ